MTVTGRLDDRQSPETFQFFVDWQLEVAAGAVTTMQKPATPRPPDTGPLSGEPPQPSLPGSTNRTRATRDDSF